MALSWLSKCDARLWTAVKTPHKERKSKDPPLLKFPNIPEESKLSGPLPSHFYCGNLGIKGQKSSSRYSPEADVQQYILKSYLVINCSKQYLDGIHFPSSI